MDHNTTALDSLSTTKLFEVLPATVARTALVIGPDQLRRWESLNGDPRDPRDIVSNPGLREGATYWVQDALHALLLRQVARRDQHVAEVLWDLGMREYAVMVASTMSVAWEW